MTREGWNESKGDKRVYIDACKGDGEPTNMAIIQKREGERTEERKRVVKSVASRWKERKKRRRYLIAKYSPRRNEGKKGVGFGKGKRERNGLA